MNRITLMGRICNDLVIKSSPNGNSYLQFRLAVDRRYQKKDKDKVTDFFNVCCWRSTAEFVSKYFGKGKLLLLDGELQTRSYTDKNGNDALFYEVIADNVYFTGEKATSPVVESVPPDDNYPSKDDKMSSPSADDYPFT